MNAYKVALLGHRYLYSQGVEKRLYKTLKDLIMTKSYVEIYIGREGEFDILAASVVKRLQKDLLRDNCEMSLVLPYLKKNIEYYAQYYDNITIPERVEGMHPKAAIGERNKWMVEKCDLLICYVERKNGGAHNALKYAQKLGKRTVNLNTAQQGLAASAY